MPDVETPEPVRPSKFYWWTAKNPGGIFRLYADEWNELTENINAVRAYNNLPYYSFTQVREGDAFTADIYNEARIAIQGVPGYGSYINRVYSGDEVTAYCLNILVSELNAIP